MTEIRVQPEQPRPSVLVVVPVPSLPLRSAERLCLTQCLRVLDRYPVRVIAPQSLDLAPLLQEFPRLTVATFEDRFFTSVDAYSELMLTPSFYERFAEYDYILIHQLDAFVFRDELAEWCARGFDYIGAPWVKERVLRSRWRRAATLAKRWLYDRLDRPARNGYRIHAVRNLLRVGNGGLSLRRVSALARVLRERAALVAEALAVRPRPLNEDEVISVLINGDGRALRVPDYRQAALFAIELCPRTVVERLNGGKLPFGCHAWEKWQPEFWIPHITATGCAPGQTLATTYYGFSRSELRPFVPAEHRRVLEVGCGRGGFRSNLRPDAEVWGIEPVAEVAADARARLHRVITGTYESARGQLPDGYFDLVVCNDVIEHMADDEAFLRTVQDKMAPGAALIGSIPNLRHWPELKALMLDRDFEYQPMGVLDRTHLRFYTIKSFPRLLRRCGLTVERFEGINRDVRRWKLLLLRLLFGPLAADVGFIQFAFVARKPGTARP